MSNVFFFDILFLWAIFFFYFTLIVSMGKTRETILIKVDEIECQTLGRKEVKGNI